MYDIPLTCKQCGGPHEKVDHVCPWCRAGLVETKDDWIQATCDEMDREDALYKVESSYSFGWTDPKTIYGITTYLQPPTPRKKSFWEWLFG